MLPERKKQNMATMNRMYSLYSVCYKLSLKKESERGLIFMPTYKTKQMRENVALTAIRSGR